MAKCKDCGSEYLTRECIKCRDKKILYKMDDIKLINKKEKMFFLRFIIFLLILAIVGAGALANFKYKELNEKMNNFQTNNQFLENENENLKKSIETYKRLAESLKKDNIEMVHKLRNQNNRSYVINNRSTNKQPQVIQNETSNIYQENIKNNVNRVQNKTVNQNRQEVKYQSFSNNIKLVSDSKITKEANNKLNSNAPIYGRYYPKGLSFLNANKNQIANIRCGLNNKRYKVVDECSMDISDNYDRVYLGTMDSRSIKNFNYKTHMIECVYSKEYGIMHNCKIKLYDLPYGKM